MIELINAISNYKNGTNNSLTDLLNRLEPLLKKYAYKLNYEDALADLQLHVIQTCYNINIETLLNKTDGAMIKYFEKCIYFKYISLSKKQNLIKNNEIILNEEINIEEWHNSYIDDFSDILFSDIQKYLTDKEYLVIKGLFFCDFTVPEIAEILGQSNWNIYKLKSSAFKKLKLTLSA